RERAFARGWPSIGSGGRCDCWLACHAALAMLRLACARLPRPGPDLLAFAELLRPLLGHRGHCVELDVARPVRLLLHPGPTARASAPALRSTAIRRLCGARGLHRLRRAPSPAR